MTAGRTSARRAAAAPSSALRRGDDSWPSSRSARPSVFRIFSSSSASRMLPAMCHASRARPAAIAELDAESVPAPGVLATRDRCRRVLRRCSWRSARPRPVPARRVVKYGSKMRGRSSSAMPMPVSRIGDGDAAIAGLLRDQRDASARRAAPSIGVIGVGEQVDQHGAQPLAVGDRAPAAPASRLERHRRPLRRPALAA